MPNDNGVTRTTEGQRYARPGRIEASHGITRTALYQWEKRGLIRLIHIKPPGAKRGTTLVDLAELEALIARFRGRPQEEEAA